MWAGGLGASGKEFCSVRGMSSWLSDTGDLEPSPEGSEGGAVWPSGGAAFQAEGTADTASGALKKQQEGLGAGAERARGRGMRDGSGKDPSGSVWRKGNIFMCLVSRGRQESRLTSCGLAGCYPWG